MGIKSAAKKISKFIGLFILLLILLKADREKIITVLSGVSFIRVFLAYSVIIPCAFAVSYRWHIILNSFSIKRRYFDNVKLYFAGILLGNITPGRVGEFYRVIRLSKEGYSMFRSAFTILLARFIDLSLIFIYSIAGGFYLLSHTTFSSSAFLPSVITGLILIVTVMGSLFLFKEQTIRIMFPLIRKLMKTDVSEEELLKSISELNPLLLFKALILTQVFWTGYFFAIYLLGKEVGINIGFSIMFLILSITTIAAAFPLTIMGLGTREFALINCMLLLGIPPERSLALSVLMYTYFAFTTVFFSVFWYLEHK